MNGVGPPVGPARRTVVGASPVPSRRRMYAWFWGSLLVAVLASGSLSEALAAEPGPATALRFAASGLVSSAAVAVALRVLVLQGRPPSTSATPALLRPPGAAGGDERRHGDAVSGSKQEEARGRKNR